MKTIKILFAFALTTAALFGGGSSTDWIKLRQNGYIQLEGATNDDFETRITAIDPTQDNAIQTQNASGTLAFLADTSSLSGTANTHTMFTTDGSTVGDSFIRQTAGHILIDDGVNDIVDIDFATLPSGAISLQIGNVSGAMAVASDPLSNGEIPKGTGTFGEIVGSNLKFTGVELETASGGALDVLKLRDLKGHGSANTQINFGSTLLTFKINNAPKLRIVDGSVIIGNAGTDFEVNLAHQQKSSIGGNSGITKVSNLTDDRSYEQPDMSGTKALWASQSETITGDDFIITVTSTLINLDSDGATSTDRSFTLATTNAVAGQTLTIVYDDSSGGDDAEILTGSANMLLSSGTITFNADNQVIMFIFDGTDWQQLTALKTNI